MLAVVLFLRLIFYEINYWQPVDKIVFPVNIVMSKIVKLNKVFR